MHIYTSRIPRRRLIHVLALLTLLFGQLRNSGGDTSIASAASIPSVRPILECVVDRGGGQYTAYFGYLNRSTKSVSIPVGPNNRLYPKPLDRGQPTVFQPGRSPAYPNTAFGVNFNGGWLTWLLNYRVAVATKYSLRCPKTPPPSDTTPPTAPTNLHTTSASTTVIGLAWNASKDNVGVVDYDVFSGTTFITNTVSTAYSVTGLQPSSSYSFTVYANDRAGNTSAASNILTARTADVPPPPDTTAPSVPVNLRLTAASETALTVAWDAARDNVGVTGYDVYVGTMLIATSAQTTYTLTGLTPSTSYSFTVRARDAANNVSAPSAVLNARTKDTPDTTAPTAPANLRMTANTATSISLTWDAAADNVGVTGYDLFNGTTVVATTAQTSYTMTGLAKASSYSFTVRAKDAAGNISALSEALVARTTDGLPPDPGSVAPPVAEGVQTSIGDATQFLYTGSNPIQTGVATGTIRTERVAVLRGRVLAANGAPLGGATVRIAQHPELGQTLSRADGWYDLAVNGGGTLVIEMERDGFLPVQRTVAVPWRDYVSTLR